MTRNFSQWAILAAKFTLPAAILAYLLGWHIGPEDWRALAEQPKRFGLLATALAVALSALCLSFGRWWLLVRAQSIELSLVEAFRLGSIGFLLSFVSAGSVGGDLFKAVFLARRRPGKRVEAVASVLVDRACGLYGLLLLVAIAFVAVDLGGHPGIGDEPSTGQAGDLRGDLRGMKWGVSALILGGTAVLAGLILGGRRIDRWLRSAGRLGLVGGPLTRLAGPLRMFHERPVALAVGVLMSVAVQAMLAVSLFLIARGLYASPPTLGEHFVIVPLAMVASALPISPAGLGVMEAAMESLYHLVPAEATVASGTLVALVFELVKLTVAGIGTLFYWTAPAEVRDSMSDGDVAEVAGAG